MGVNALNLNVVFQGGGANLVSLMAAAAVLEDLEEAGKIKVKSVAGVSAGAIAACMYSTPTRIDAYRDRIDAVGQKFIPKFRLKTKSKLSRLLIAINVIAGRPLFDDKDLLEFFDKIFVNGSSGIETFDDLKIPTRIVATDLRKKTKLVYGPEAVTGKSVIEGLVDSCALPFAFRTFQHGNIIDGGVVNNFPIDEVMSDDENVYTLGFGFKSRPTFGSKSSFSYALSLLTTSIDSTVKENGERLKALGGEVCLLPKNYGLIEFEKALTEGLESEAFDTLKKTIKSDMLVSISALNERSLAQGTVEDLRKKIITVYDYLNNHHPHEREVVSRLYADSLLDEGVKDRNIATLRIRPTNEAIQVFSNSIGVNMQPVIRGAEEWSVEDADGNSLAAERILGQYTQPSPEGTEATMHKAMYFLREPFTKEQGWLSAVQVSHSRFMEPYREFGVDYFRHQSLPPHNLKKVVHLIYVPKECGEMILGDLKENVDFLKAKGMEAIPETVNMGRNWSRGKPLLGQNLAPYVQDQDKLKYHIYGWETLNVKTGFFCGVALACKSRAPDIVKDG